ncbi:MAG: ferritin-like domain-containing protein [Deltaproteobacteria bacterium]|nr:MAG: ferritin-like domain-containing protein [Deltaproteobacteria bacterium]
MRGVPALIDSALRNAWSFKELPWHLEVDPDRGSFPEESFFAGGLRPFRAMSSAQRRAFVFRETCFHLSNLLAGERSGEHLVAQVLVLTARERPGHREFLALMAQEEAKHFLALQKYLSEKASVLYPPCRRLFLALEAVEACASPEVKLLVGQVVFEWTAASLVSTLLVKAREPLLSAVLRVNLRDESRHLAYSYELREPLAKVLTGRVAPEMEDLVFESVRASVSALLAEPVWSELGLEARAMRRHALERLERLGVLDRYRKLVPEQLARCGFPVAKLTRRLGKGLVRGLVADG